MSVLALAAAAQMTFICTPSDVERHEAPYVISFQQRDERLRRIWVIWPDGSQSDENWSGAALGNEFVIRAQKGITTHRLTLRRDPARSDRAHLSAFLAVTGDNLSRQMTDEVECSVRNADTMRGAA